MNSKETKTQTSNIVNRFANLQLAKEQDALKLQSASRSVLDDTCDQAREDLLILAKTWTPGREVHYYPVMKYDPSSMPMPSVQDFISLITHRLGMCRKSAQFGPSELRANKAETVLGGAWWVVNWHESTFPRLWLQELLLRTIQYHMLEEPKSDLNCVGQSLCFSVDLWAVINPNVDPVKFVKKSLPHINAHLKTHHQLTLELKDFPTQRTVTDDSIVFSFTCSPFAPTSPSAPVS